MTDWKPDPKPPVTVFSGSPDEMIEELWDTFADGLWDNIHYSREMTEDGARIHIAQSTSFIIAWGNQCRHCGDFDGTVEFYDDAGKQVFYFDFTD